MNAAKPPKPRQPIVSWSSVVLLSALLLSPMTAGALWHALAERFPQAFAAFADIDGFAALDAFADDAVAPNADTAGVTRRANDESQELRSAARADARTPAPDSTFPFTVRAAMGERFGISLLSSAPAWSEAADARARFRAISPACPRAPPV